MTSELLEIVELGNAENLVEMGLTSTTVEPVDRYVPSTTPYVESVKTNSDFNESGGAHPDLLSSAFMY